MKLSLFLINSILVVVSAIPFKQHLQNDMSDKEMLPQESSSTQESLNSTVSSGGDKNCRIMHKLRYRNRRDVSHLDSAYLPAEISQDKATGTALPSSAYLPPENSSELPFLNTAAPTDDAEDDTESSHLKNKYLPPSVTYLPPPSATYLPPPAEAASELPQVPSSEYLPPIQTGEDLSELPLEGSSETGENKDIEAEVPEKSSAETVNAPNETTQDSTVLDADGYHYKTPDIKPDLLLPVEPTKDYLPALGETIMEGPEYDDSTVLRDDGYHYRSFKLHF